MLSLIGIYMERCSRLARIRKMNNWIEVRELSVKSLFIIGFACCVMSQGALAATFTPNPSVDRSLRTIDKCEEVTLSRCPALKLAINRGPGQVPYLAQVIENSDMPALRRSAAYVLQFFPQEEGLKALAMQFNRERNRGVRKALRAALGVRGEGPLLRLVRELYKSKEPGDRVIASNLIGEFSLHSGSADLVSASRDSVPRVQYAAVTAMGKINVSPEVSRTLYLLLGDQRTPWTLRQKAIITTGELNMVDAAPLVALAFGNTEKEVQKAACKVLAGFNSQWATPALISLLSDPDVAGTAAIALSELGDKSASAPLISVLSNEQMPFREMVQVLWALGTLEAEDAVPTLLAMLKHENADLVYHVANNLGRIKSREATLPLIMTMKHEREQIRDIALWSLEQITGEKHGFENEKWLQWYKSKSTSNP